MDMTREINILQAKRGIKDVGLARELKWTPQSLSQRKRINAWKWQHIEEVAEAMGCTAKVVFTDRETGEEV